MNKHLYKIIIAALIVVLCVVSFYMLWVHVPYYNYHHRLDEIRNEICETNQYEYMGYFHEHKGKSIYYILKVKINNVETYVAYDKELKLVDYYQGQVCDEKIVKNAILKKYKDIVQKEDIKALDIGYENNKFVYYTKVQRDDLLMYIYYDLETGDFVKTYNISGM